MDRHRHGAREWPEQGNRQTVRQDFVNNQIKQKILTKIQMFRNNVLTFKNLPVEENVRKRTDFCCTIVGALLALILFILSFVLFRKENFYQVNYPTDSNGNTCYYDQPQAPYLFFADPNDITTGRYCVSTCPAQGQALQCSDTDRQYCSKVTGSQYSSSNTLNRLGAFCMPNDQSTAQNLWSLPQLQDKYSILDSIDTILLSLLLGLFVGIIYLALVTCFPKIMIWVAFVGAFLTLLAGAIIILAANVQLFKLSVWNILFAVLLIIASFCILCCIREMKLAGIFLTHANSFLKSDPLVLLYIPLFLLLNAGLFVLVVWQYIAFGTVYETTFSPNSVYRTSNQNYYLQILNAIELLWGLQFLRDAYNFLISGNAVEWYFRSQQNNYQSHCCHPFSRLIIKNWGSIAGGSFLHAFFTPFDMLSQLFRCDPRGSCSKCTTCYKSWCCCEFVFELIRSDAYSYINLTGIPYCNAARQCEALCQYSDSFRGGRSCLRLYRTASHIFTTMLVAIICFFILRAKGASYTNWFIIGLIVLGAYCILSYFVDTHANSGEGLMTSYLSQRNCEGDYMQVCPAALREDMYEYNTNQTEL